MKVVPMPRSLVTCTSPPSTGDDVLNDRQAQPGPVTALGGKERVEDALQNVLLIPMPLSRRIRMTAPSRATPRSRKRPPSAWRRPR